ncbi:MAG: helix-turn-helix transcriptional regulator [Alphaproteobacteria bacterium]|nr:helix-turn-helix transcriptional regulator [Alphaproteobacteria bacterium]
MIALQQGTMLVDTPAVTYTIRPADLAIIPLNANCKFAGTDFHADLLVVDEQLSPILPSGMTNRGPLILSALSSGTSLLYQQFLCFKAYADLIQKEDTEELLPPLLMMLNTIVKRQARKNCEIRDSQLDRIRGLIQERLLDPELGPDLIVSELGLSRARLYRIAEPLGGITKYIRAQRLQLAHETLASGHMEAVSITNLAYDLGFRTETAFRRSFKEAFDMTPSEVRKRATNSF